MTSFEFDKVRERLKRVRNSLGKNQTEMGELTGKGVYYGNIERGNQEPALLALIDIANALNISGDWLLYGTGESPIPEKIPTKTPEIVIPTVEEKKELAPAAVPAPGPKSHILVLSRKIHMITYHAECQDTQAELVIHAKTKEDGIWINLEDNPWTGWMPVEQIPGLINILQDAMISIREALS